MTEGRTERIDIPLRDALGLMRERERKRGEKEKEVFLCGPIDHFNVLQGADRGWGCGYRNIQMLASYIMYQSQSSDLFPIPVGSFFPLRLLSIFSFFFSLLIFSLSLHFRFHFHSFRRVFALNSSQI